MRIDSFRGYLPSFINSIFNHVICPQGKVLVHIWDVKQGTERGGHTSVEVYDNKTRKHRYFSAWAIASPEQLLQNQSASMLIIDKQSDDHLIVGFREFKYSAGERNNPDDPNSIDRPSAPESLTLAKGMNENDKEEITQLSKPTTIVLYTLDTAEMISYLDQIKLNQEKYSWSQAGIGTDRFNCTTHVWGALKIGGIGRLYKSNAKMFSLYSVSASIISLPILYKYWQCLLAYNLGISALGGILDAQISAIALLKIFNAHYRNNCLAYLGKSLLWFGEVLFSGITSGLTFGLVDNLFHNIYMAPEMIRMICENASKTENYCTISAAVPDDPVRSCNKTAI